jgi:hypothetical protein
VLRDERQAGRKVIVIFAACPVAEAQGRKVFAAYQFSMIGRIRIMSTTGTTQASRPHPA